MPLLPSVALTAGLEGSSLDAVVGWCRARSVPGTALFSTDSVQSELPQLVSRRPQSIRT